jgi:hypothetical protein
MPYDPAALRAALAALFGLSDDDPAIAALIRDVCDYQEHSAFVEMTLGFERGELVRVNGRKFRRGRRVVGAGVPQT